MIHVRVPNIKLAEGRRVHIIPLGDIQSESQRYRLDGLVKWALEQWQKGNKVFFFMLGDYFECTSPSERWKLAGANLHEPTYETLNQAYIALANDFVARLTPVKRHVWGVLTGHHSANLMLKKGMETKHSDIYIAEKLGTEYAGDGVASFYLTVNGLPFKIMATHGYGSARTRGAQITKRLRMRETIADCNWYVMGHDNYKGASEEEPFILTPEGPRAVKQLFSGIGSLQESYELGRVNAGYAEKLNLAPSSIGFVRMTIQVERDREGRQQLDYHERL